MIKTVFILGAGASRAAGGPLMYDFIDNAMRIYRKGEGGWADKHFENILSARKKLQHAFVKSRIDLDNIENFFATCEMASLIGKLSNLDQKTVESLPESLRYMIMRTLEQAILFDINGNDKYIPSPYPYDAFTDLLIELQKEKDISPLCVINFNYDLCFDYALSMKNFKPEYGLGKSNPKQLNTIPHYKVHGSLNWIQEKNSIKANLVKPLLMERYWERLGFNRGREYPIDTMELIFGPHKWGERIFPDPVIVPPTWNKGWYQEQLKTVWRNASEALSSAENIFVLGYSLPASDQFFRSFWSLSTISDNIVDKFWLFDPSTEDNIIERYTSFLGPAIIERGKFRFERQKFTGAIRSIAQYYGFEVNNLVDR